MPRIAEEPLVRTTIHLFRTDYLYLTTRYPGEAAERIRDILRAAVEKEKGNATNPK